MAKTLSGTYSNGYVLADATLDPVTNLGTILFGTSANAAALEGNTVAAWSVLNQGTINGNPGSGIDLLAGGTVTNATSGWIGGAYGVAIQGVAGTVANHGTIVASAAGVFLTRGGEVTNAAGGQISGGYGVKIQYGPGSVLNAGTVIANPTNAAISLLDGGSATNAAGGTLNGKWGISIQGSATGTAVNYGVIIGGSESGVFLTGGAVTNAAGGQINGYWGVADLTAAATVINGGIIGGGGGTRSASVLLPEGYANRVVVLPGAVFNGAVEGGNTIGGSVASTLELAPGTASGTLAGIGGTIAGFADIAFDTGATWDVSGVLAGFGGTVYGFAAGDRIRLTDVVANSGTFAAGELSLFENGTAVGQIAMAGSFASNAFNVDPTDGISIACFAAGTRIATPHGEIAVEALVAGQFVTLANGGSAPVRWLGHRRLDCTRHPQPAAVWPVRVAAGAFGPRLPLRDLWLSPDHAVFVDNVLLPVRCLLNGATVVQEPVAEVRYFHVELPAHQVIIANGLPCESFLDIGNRGAFENGGGALLLHPDFAARIWQRDACAELILGGPKLAAVRWRLLREAARLGHVACDDPAPCLRLGRTLLRPQQTGIGVRFLVPAATRSVRLVSRICIHAEMLDGTTARRHGLAVAGLMLDRQAISLGDPRLGAGWHAPAAGVRWTDGDARITLRGAREILLVLAPSGPYWSDAAGGNAARVSDVTDQESANDAAIHTAIRGPCHTARPRRAGARTRTGDDTGERPDRGAAGRPGHAGR